MHRSFSRGDRGKISIEYEALQLLSGNYELKAGIEKSIRSRANYDSAPPVHITIGSSFEQGAGIAHLPHAWRLATTSEDQVNADLAVKVSD